MAKKLYEETKIAEIAKKIREKTRENDAYTTEQMPQGIDRVYDVARDVGQSEGWEIGYYEGKFEGYDEGWEDAYYIGYEDGEDFGYSAGYADGIESGKKEQRDAFWDAFQDYGRRTDYENCFQGDRWNETTFKPKYDLKPVTARNMFGKFGDRYGLFSLADYLESAGVVLDCTNVTTGRSMFAAFHGNGIPPLVFNKATDLNSLFYDCLWLDNIDITLNIDKSANIAGIFGTCKALKNLTVRGVIAGTGVSLQWSTGLTKTSFTSVIHALSEETSGLSITFSKTAKEAAFTTEEWSALIATKPNWTISLV